MIAAGKSVARSAMIFSHDSRGSLLEPLTASGEVVYCLKT